MVSENFNPTLGTESFFSRAVESWRCFKFGRRPCAWKVSDTQGNFDQNSITNLEIVSEVLICWFLSVSESRIKRFAAKVSDLKARIPVQFLCSIGHSLFVSANDSFKKNADIARESREILRTVVWEGAPICPPPILWGIYIFPYCRRITFTVAKW